MLKTERMRKVIVAGAERHQRAVIETLHSLRAVHIEEHAPEAGDFFTLGSPLPEGEQVAKALLRARGLQNSLGLEDARPTYALDSVDAAVARVDAVDRSVAGIIDERATLEERVKELESEVLRLRRLQPLGLRLEELSGYTQVKAYVGAVASDPRDALAAVSDRIGVWTGRDDQGMVVLAVAPPALAEKTEATLADHGFSALEVPEGSGPVDTVVGARTSEIGQTQERMRALDAQLVRYRDEHGPELLAAVETLEIASEKSGAPVLFASGPTSFVVTGYVPASRAAATEEALLSATEHRVHLDWEEPEAADAHAGHHIHAEEPAGDAHHHESDPADEPPVRFTHKNATTRSFTMLLGMHSLPRYKEIDPTWFMYLTFPLFFGLMIGDVGFGLLTIAVAWFLKNNYVIGIGGPKVGRMLIAAGVWTVGFGLIFYGEAFGIHFVDAPGTISWEWLFGADWSHLYAENVHATAHAAEAAGDAAHGEGEHGAAPHLVLFGFLQLGFFSKLHDVVALLIIAVGFAAVHLNLALLLGVRNAWVMHGAKHAILGRVSWIVLQLGVVGFAWGYAHDLQTYIQGGWAVFILAVVMLIWGEGAIAILELPKIFSNALSYTRLTAVALSKAGMTLAVTTFAFVEVDAHHWALNGVFGAVLILFGFAVILLLGILSGGLHAMRLQFVEFFGWFYEGGGRRFKAFGDPAERHD